jgi:hypothetical protein
MTELTVTAPKGHDATRPAIEIKIVPGADSLFGLQLTAVRLPEKVAGHLYSHIADAVQDFLDCTGATVRSTVLARNTKTGEEIVRDQQEFGPGSSEPIDPKKVN